MLKEASLANSLGDNARDAAKYMVESAQPIPEAYTRKTFSEGARIKDHLSGEYQNQGILADFTYQGSVTNDTHIRYHSDIDLLVLTGKFHGRRPPLAVTSPYQGDPIADLIELREIAVASLSSGFPMARIDDTGARSISIAGGSLARKIDVVPGNWLHTKAFEEGRHEYRGIQILNYPARERESNFPFLHNHLLNVRDIMLGGNLRRLIRLAKSIKADSDLKIDISSYDIAGLCYAIPLDKMLGDEEELLLTLVQFCGATLEDAGLQGSLLVPNGTRKLFGSMGVTTTELSKLVSESIDLLLLARK